MAEKWSQQHVLQQDLLVDNELEYHVVVLGRCWLEAAEAKVGSEGVGFAILGVRSPL